MNRKSRIYDLLKKNLLNFNIEIKDNSSLHTGHHGFDGKGETHLLIILNKIENLKTTRLEIHRKINKLLTEEFNSGLHSIEIKIT
tara:strand:- start:791 stop:1045 length:255 start_codon:yes stop_codon:yes gene_type:complete